MDNFQKFNIINPKRGTCETHYERAGLPPMWQRCLRYRPRAKDFRVLRPPVNRIRRMQRSVGRHWSHTPVDVQAKNSMSFGRALKAPTTSIKAAQTPGPDKTLAPHSVKSMGPNLTEPFDSVPLHTPIKELKVEETCEELAIGTALPSADVMHSGTYSSSKQLHSNHQIGIALTTTQTISNYSNPKKCSHNVRIQEKGDNTVRDDSRPDDTSSWEISPAEKDSSRYKSQESAGAGHVDISTLVPDYAVSKRKTVTPERLEDGIQYQPLPRSSSTHNLVQELEIDACRPEHGRLIESRYGDGQEPRKPRNSRRCGQVWDGEETRNNFLAIEILTQNIRLT